MFSKIKNLDAHAMVHVIIDLLVGGETEETILYYRTQHPQSLQPDSSWTNLLVPEIWEFWLALTSSNTR